MPNTIAEAMGLAMQHHRAGRFAEAEGMCRQILQHDPNHIGATNLLCIVVKDSGRIEEAIQLGTRASAAHPRIAEFHANLGAFLGIAGRHVESAGALRRAIELNPCEATFRNGLGIALDGLRDYEAAAREFRKAVELKPDYAMAYSSLSAILRQLGKLDEAIAAANEAVRLDPQLAVGHYNLAGMLVRLGRYEEGIAAYLRVIALNQNLPQAHTYLGTLYLLLGDFARGWSEHEWRSNLAMQRPPNRWLGGELKGRTILLIGDQGFGDQIQFCRYGPMLAEMGARVILACNAELVRLMRSLCGVAEVIPLGHESPAFDVCCPLLSVPMALGTTLENIPAKVPYLKAANPRPVSGGLKRVGLVWAGNPGHYEDRWRSIRPEELTPLWEIEGVEFVSLQKGDAAEQAKELERRLPLIDPTDGLKDFSDTADVISGLDLVISVDTSVAHLAGALGKAVWVMLPASPDWRWLLERGDSPWYPTMRLFRQTVLGDWRGVVGEMGVALRGFAGSFSI
jgi:tetratricopeptide (TPR) repeat protein